MSIELGKEVEDITSGLIGYAVARCEFINGAVQYGIRTKASSSLPIPEVVYIDEECLVETGEQIKMTPKKRMGFTLSD